MARSIQAIVDYPGPGQIGNLGGGSRPHVEVLVKNNSTTGIASTEIDTGGDKGTVPMQIGAVGRTLRMNKIVAQDESILQLLCY